MQLKPYRLIIGTKTASKDKSSNLEDSKDDYGDYYADEQNENIETINEIIESKWTKDKTGGYRCKECDFTHKRRDVMRDHIEEHHVDTGGAECHVCQKICKTREKLRRHMYSHQKRVSMSSLSSHHLL